MSKHLPRILEDGSVNFNYGVIRVGFSTKEEAIAYWKEIANPKDYTLHEIVEGNLAGRPLAYTLINDEESA